MSGSPLRVLSASLALVLASMLAVPAAAQIEYVAFGDSITEGFGDDAGQRERGYPPRLAQLLADRGVNATVTNFGLGGETTAEGLSRIPVVFSQGGDVLLLMEGTNDIGMRISPETIRFNLDSMADRAENNGFEVVLATIIPRFPTANFDGSNRITGRLAGLIRELAHDEARELVDPFQVFFRDTPGVFDELYVGGGDRLHPNGEGYDALAEIFADVLTGVDNVPPVTGLVSPEDDDQNVSPNTAIAIDLYDFGAGIDMANTSLRINDQLVTANITGDSDKLEIRYQPPAPLSGVVFVGLSSRDLAAPANNTLDRNIMQFVIAGTQFLPGDIDRDGRVDGTDLVLFAVRFGSERGDGRFRAFADLNGDDAVDGRDLAILASNFGGTAS
ncbi:MAG: GDSL-type esterase/lipase family protein [Acidobacteriota bacterium]|nr:GDSL-type esterase/lipase family protein [Acidobacteriota bacterium]